MGQGTVTDITADLPPLPEGVTEVDGPEAKPAPKTKLPPLPEGVTEVSGVPSKSGTAWVEPTTSEAPTPPHLRQTFNSPTVENVPSDGLPPLPAGIQEVHPANPNAPVPPGPGLLGRAIQAPVRGFVKSALAPIAAINPELSRGLNKAPTGDSWWEKGLGIAGSVVPIVASGPFAPEMAAAGGIAGVRGDIAERRKQGEQIGGGAEATAALGAGAIDAATVGVIGKLAGGTRGLGLGKRFVANAAIGTGGGVGGNVAHNISAKTTYDPNRPILQGTGESAVWGGLIGLASTPRGIPKQRQQGRFGEPTGEVIDPPIEAEVIDGTYRPAQEPRQLPGPPPPASQRPVNIDAAREWFGFAKGQKYSKDEAIRAFQIRRNSAHPDRGGTTDDFIYTNNLKDVFLRGASKSAGKGPTVTPPPGAWQRPGPKGPPPGPQTVVDPTNPSGTPPQGPQQAPGATPAGKPSRKASNKPEARKSPPVASEKAGPPKDYGPATPLEGEARDQYIARRVELGKTKGLGEQLVADTAGRAYDAAMANRASKSVEPVSEAAPPAVAPEPAQPEVPEPKHPAEMSVAEFRAAKRADLAKQGRTDVGDAEIDQLHAIHVDRAVKVGRIDAHPGRSQPQPLPPDLTPEPAAPRKRPGKAMQERVGSPAWEVSMQDADPLAWRVWGAEMGNGPELHAQELKRHTKAEVDAARERLLEMYRKEGYEAPDIFKVEAQMAREPETTPQQDSAALSGLVDTPATPKASPVGMDGLTREQRRAKGKPVTPPVHPNAVKSLDEAIASNDLGKLNDWLHRGNKALRALFTEKTGVELPDSVKGTLDALREWTGQRTPAAPDTKGAPSRASQAKRNSAIDTLNGRIRAYGESLDKLKNPNSAAGKSLREQIDKAREELDSLTGTTESKVEKLARLKNESDKATAAFRDYRGNDLGREAELGDASQRAKDALDEAKGIRSSVEPQPPKGAPDAVRQEEGRQAPEVLSTNVEASPPAPEQPPARVATKTKQNRATISKAQVEGEIVERGLAELDLETQDLSRMQDPDEIGQHAGKVNSELFNTTFRDALPGEVLDRYKDQPHILKKFTVLKPGDKGYENAHGNDSMGSLDDRYWQLVEESAKGDLNRVKEQARDRMSPASPRLQFLVALHDMMGDIPKYIRDPLKKKGTKNADGTTRQKQGVKLNPDYIEKSKVDVSSQKVGTKFEFEGHKFEIIETEDGWIALKDGDDFPLLPASEIGEMPIDKGTLKKGKPSKSGKPKVEEAPDPFGMDELPPATEAEQAEIDRQAASDAAEEVVQPAPQPKQMPLINERNKLRTQLEAIPGGDAPETSAAFRRHEELARPLIAKIEALNEKIGDRPDWWQPNRDKPTKGAVHVGEVTPEESARLKAGLKTPGFMEGPTQEAQASIGDMLASKPKVEAPKPAAQLPAAPEAPSAPAPAEAAPDTTAQRAELTKLLNQKKQERSVAFANRDVAEARKQLDSVAFWDKNAKKLSEHVANIEAELAKLGPDPNAPPPAKKPKRKPKDTGFIDLSPVLDVTGKVLDEFVGSPVRAYSEPFRNAMLRLGGKVGQKYANLALKLSSRAKANYAIDIQLIDAARDAVRKMSSATTWMMKVGRVKGGVGVKNIVDATEGNIASVPAPIRPTVQKFRDGNLAIGKKADGVVPGFKATGRFQRNLTEYGMNLWLGPWTGKKLAVARWISVENNIPLAQVRKQMDDVALQLQKGDIAGATRKINQEYSREWTHFPTSIKDGGWQDITHASPDGYLARANRVTSSRVAVLQEIGTDPAKIQAMRQEIMDAGGDARAFDAMLRAAHEMPSDMGLTSTLAPAGSIRRKVANVANEVSSLFKTVFLSGAAPANSLELFVGSVPQSFGLRNSVRGWAKLIQGGKKYQADLEARGLIDKAMYDWAFDPTRPVRSISRITKNAIGELSFNRWLNELTEAHAAATVDVVTELAKAKRLGSWKQAEIEQVARAMGFGEKNAKEIANGTATPALYEGFQRTAASFMTGGNRIGIDSSPMQLSRTATELLPFQSYGVKQVNQMRTYLNNFKRAVTEKKWKQAAAAATLFGRFATGTTIQGSAQALFYAMLGGALGLSIFKSETSDEPKTFIAESFLNGLAGPFAMIYRFASGQSPKGIASALFPVSLAGEVADFVSGAGIYRDQGPLDRLATFGTRRVGGGRILYSVLAPYAISSDAKNLDTATRAFYRWRSDEIGRFTVTNDPAGSEEQKMTAEFRQAMRKATDAMARNDFKAADKELDDALLAKSKDPTVEKPKTALAASLRGRKLLKNLTDKQLESCKRRIGEQAFKLIVHHDAVLEDWAKSINRPIR